MKRLIGVLAVVLGTTAVAHDEDALAETRASLDDARARLAEAAREIAEATREQFVARVDRAMLGVLIADQDEQGVLVGGVTPDGGAEVAGLVADDVITGVNGEPLTGLDKPVRRLREVLDGVTAGDPVNVVILRDGELSDVEVVTTNAYRADLPHFDFDWVPRVDMPARVMSFRDRFERHPDDLKLVDIGADLGAYFNVDAGVLVLDTAAKSDLKPGDIVKRIDGADVASSQEAYRLLRGEGDAVVEVFRRIDGVGIVRKGRAVEVTVAKHSRRGGVSVFRFRDGGEEHEAEVKVEVDVEEAH